jgi:hypothetical protein
VKGDTLVAFCDRGCNVIAPFVAVAGNRNESPLLMQALHDFSRLSDAVCPKAKEIEEDSH